MSAEITRGKLVVLWFVFVGLAVAMASMFGVKVSIETAALLMATCLVPPALLLMLWPGVQPQTAGEVLRGDFKG